jgi:hypothetical protein
MRGRRREEVGGGMEVNMFIGERGNAEKPLLF